MWICCQIGAREHYAVARALQQRERLRAFYTDFWAGGALRRAKEMADGRWQMGVLQSLAGRFHPGLEEAEIGKRKAEIVSWNGRALGWEMLLRRSRRSEVGGQRSEAGGVYAGFIEVGRRFAIRVREELKQRQDLNPDAILFAYDTGALEAFAWCREQGIKTVLGQMDPNRVEVELVQAEEKQWPGWSLNPLQVPEEYFVRREQEWALADRVVVNSEFSRQALLNQGVPAEKLVVIPLCFEENAENLKPDKLKSSTHFSVSEFQFSASRPLRVLFLGQVILRKGIQYLIQAARRLDRENIQFDVVGPIGIAEEAIRSAPSNVKFHGRAMRDSAADWYHKADVFVLPTVSDGFAITQLEAMSQGLPVVATPNCGEVVSDGRDGFIVPARDAEALARTLQRYFAEPGLLQSQQAAALEKAGQFGLDRLAAGLVELEASFSTH